MLRRRLLASFVALTVLCTLATGLFVREGVRRTRQEDERDALVAVAAATDAATSALRAPADRTRLAEKVAELGRVAGVRLTLVAPDGRVLAETDRDPSAMENHLDRPEIRGAHPGAPGVARRVSATTGREHLYVAVASPDGHFVRAALLSDRIDEQLAHINRVLLLGLAVELGVAVLLGFAVSGRMTRRIDRQLAAANRIVAGDMTARVDARGPDEIDALGRALNRVAERLQEQIAELELRRKEIADVLDSTADGLIAVDANDVVTHVNPAAVRMFEFGAGPIGRPFWESVRDAALPELVARVRSEMRPAEADLTVDHPPPRRDLEVRVSPIRSQSGVFVGAVLAFRDVTRLHKLEQVRRDFVANVSHEMKTPLTSIQGYVETLRAGAIDDRQAAPEFLAKIERNARSLAHLVNDLLVLSRVEAGGLRTAPDPFPLAQVVAEAVAACADKAREKGVDVSAPAPAEDPQVRGDPDLLARAVVNLLDNAVQYTPAGGRVSVTTTRQDGSARVVVADTGVGIPATDLERIFERFYRVDKARSRALGGTGLGLAIVKHVAERHGGAIAVVSEPARGSTFTLSIPCEL